MPHHDPTEFPKPTAADYWKARAEQAEAELERLRVGIASIRVQVGVPAAWYRQQLTRLLEKPDA